MNDIANKKIDIQGFCDSAFSRVRDLFVELLAAEHECGAALAIMVDDRCLVDLWAGYADEARTRPWERDTLVQVMSATKAVVALASHMLVDRGLLDLDAPVAKYWPEFAAARKEDLPVRHLLSHQAGLADPEQMLPTGSITQWEVMTAALAAQAPIWTPGEAHGYHVYTFGWLVGEVIRRVSGRTPGQFIREEIARPLGVEFELGVGPEFDSRIADLVLSQRADPGVVDAITRITADLTSLYARAFLPAIPETSFPHDQRHQRAAEIPAANGHSNSRALATIASALVRNNGEDGFRLLSPEALTRATETQAQGPDLVLEEDMRLGLGFMKALPNRPETVFGHPAFGGSLIAADPSIRLGFGYVVNGLSASSSDVFLRYAGKETNVISPDRRGGLLLDAAYRVLTEL